MKNCAPEKNKNPAKRPNGMSPCGRPFNRRQGTSVAFSGTVPAGLVPPGEPKVVRLGEQWLVGSSFGGSGDR